MDQLSEIVIHLIIVISCILIFMTVLAYFAKKEYKHQYFKNQFLFWLSWSVLLLANPPNQVPHLVALNILFWPWVLKNIVTIFGHAHNENFYTYPIWKIAVPSIMTGVIIFALGGSFTQMTFIPVFSICFFFLYQILKVFKNHPFRQHSIHQKLLLIFSIIFSLHGMFYPFNRLRPELAQYDFVVMLLNILGFAATVPNVLFSAYYKKINKRLQDQVELEKQIVNNMTATINHELNTPLAILQAQIDLARIKKMPEKLTDATKSIKRIKEVIFKLRGMSTGSLAKVPYISDDDSVTKIYDIQKEDSESE